MLRNLLGLCVLSFACLNASGERVTVNRIPAGPDGESVVDEHTQTLIPPQPFIQLAGIPKAAERFCP
jgi:hypothetical protein